MFESAKFISPDIPFERYRDLSAIMFRRTFTLGSFKKVSLSFAALGIGYFYINGKPVTDAKFLSPVSDYTKTVWYYTFDVTELLNEGDNVIAATVGNGIYNEVTATSWWHNEAPWRNNPCLICQLDVDGSPVLVSDEKFKASLDSPVIYNYLRLGEMYDARKYDPDWCTLSLDDSGWERVKTLKLPAVLRPCPCAPVRECEVLAPTEIVKTGNTRYLVKFEKNISGYIRLTSCERKGQPITVRYAEDYDEYNAPIIDMRAYEMSYITNGHRVVTDTFISNGEKFTWSPAFTYHGFCCVEIEGVTGEFEISAVFTHQDLRQRSYFECSDPMLTKLYELGVTSCYSNMCYIPTDCPTREKLGWMNDAKSSADNLLTVFDSAEFFEKWMQDIYDAMRDDGALPGIVPTSGWGFEWGNGPVSDGALFEIPYQIYVHTGNAKPLTDSIPYFRRYLDYIESRGYCIGLGDWAPPVRETRLEADSIADLLCIRFYEIALDAMKTAGEDTGDYPEKYRALRETCRKKYIGDDGRCKIDRMSVIAIYSRLVGPSDTLKEQLKKTIEKENFHHDCGMVGLPYLYRALDDYGLDDYAYRIITATGFPSYSYWLDEGNARSLHEMWTNLYSRNHHMYSDVMCWLLRHIAGINKDGNTTVIRPRFYDGLDYACGSIDGTRVTWRREDGGITLTVDTDIPVVYNGKALPAGKNEIKVC